MAVTLEALNTRIDAAVTAIDAGNYATALIQIRGAMAIQAALPSAIKGSSALTHDRQQLVELEKICLRAQASSAGVQRTPIKYEPTPADEDDD